MKRVALCILFIGFFTTAAFPFQIGAEFSAGGAKQLGLNLRFNHLFELKPQLGFSFSEDVNTIDLGISGNFYFADIDKLQHYAGFGIAMASLSESHSAFSFAGQYGLRYNINDVISIFGEGGIITTPDPFFLTTISGAIGCTIYYPNFK